MEFRLFHNAGFTILNLLLIVACSSTANTSNNSGAGGSTSLIPGGGAGGQGTSGGASGAIGSAGASGSTGGLNTGGAMAGSAGTVGTGGTAGAAGAAGAGGVSIAGSGGEATGGTGGEAAGGAAGAAGAGGTGGVVGGVRTGMSVGCGEPPRANDSSDSAVKYDVDIAGLDPVYLPGGEYHDSSGAYDFSHRPYSVRLPQGYDPNTPYKVTFGGGGCGAAAGNWDGGLGLQIAGNGNTLQVGLMYITTCFEDGGPDIGNRTDTPDEPYFRAVMADLEAHYCIDLSQVFVSGFSSGAWEAYTLGCAASDLIRGISAAEGGMRDMRPPCKGPVAAVLVAKELDGENPIGPLDDNNPDDLNAINRLGSHGSAPGRDDILARNGCVGTATAPYSDPTYSACVQYTGCPAAYPVIWCALPGLGHGSTTYNGQNYSPGPMWDVLGSLPPP